MRASLNSRAFRRTLVLAAGAALILTFGTDRTTGQQLSGPLSIKPPEESEPAERPVSFTSEQADRGEVRYNSDCQECHGDDLKGGLNGGAPIRGLAFEQKYEGLPASVMFSFMTSAMPPNAPGRYSETTYAELMAYILKRNGFQPGAPLPSNLDELDQLIIEK